MEASAAAACAEGLLAARRGTMITPVENPEEKDMLEDLVVAAANQALQKASVLAQDEMQKATGGMMPQIPGMKFPGM